MILRATANLSAVKAFESSVSELKEYSQKLDKGLRFLEEFSKLLNEKAVSLRETLNSMSSAREELESKIKRREELTAKLAAQLKELDAQLSDHKKKLASIPSTIMMTTDSGKTCEVRNPAYAAMQAVIAADEGKLSAAKAELQAQKARLEHAISIKKKITAHFNTVNRTANSLDEYGKNCRQLQTELADIQRKNLNKCSMAADGLKKIEKIILKYMRIKMEYENAKPLENPTMSDAQASGMLLKNNDNTTTSTDVQEAATPQHPKSEQSVSSGNQTVPINENIAVPQYAVEEIVKHNIKFDDAGRVSFYDGKSFGGKYKQYEDRRDNTLDDNNPILGRYEGIRGESVFIPSDRSAGGIVVKEILSQYGVEGIAYRNAEPDFEVCAEAVVKISHMTENREDYTNDSGETVEGNFTQADIKLAEAWNLDKREGRNDWLPRDVFNYRKKNKLSWHEKCDTETMVLVRTEINLFFNHSGGCAECRVRDAAENVGGDFDE